jgi:hypothetical protein
VARIIRAKRKGKNQGFSWKVIFLIKKKDSQEIFTTQKFLKSFRHEFDVPNSSINQLHGPTTPEEAEQELAKFFPMEQTVALIKPGLTPDEKSSNILLI